MSGKVPPWIAPIYVWWAERDTIGWSLSLPMLGLVCELADAVPDDGLIWDCGSGLSSAVLHALPRRMERRVRVRTFDMDPSYLARTKERVTGRWPAGDGGLHFYHPWSNRGAVLALAGAPDLVIWDLGYPKDRAPELLAMLTDLRGEDAWPVIALDDWHFREADAMKRHLVQAGYDVREERERTLDRMSRFGAVARARLSP